jgi:hypothetical protein
MRFVVYFSTGPETVRLIAKQAGILLCFSWFSLPDTCTYGTERIAEHMRRSSEHPV